MTTNKGDSDTRIKVPFTRIQTVKVAHPGLVGKLFEEMYAQQQKADGTDKTHPDLKAVTGSGMLRIFIDDYAQDFIVRCTALRSEMLDASFLMRKGPLHMHDFSMANIADASATLARELVIGFQAWAHDGSTGIQRLKDVTEYRVLEVSVFRVSQRLMELKRMTGRLE